jgi:hypothetical protein
MKKTKYPNLRTHTRKGASGQVWTWWTYDRRAQGLPELPLGKDYNAAIVQWKLLSSGAPSTQGRIQEAIDKWRSAILPTYTVPNTREQYATYLKQIESWCGHMAWHEIDFPLLCQYLDRRTKKTSANRELSVLAIVWKRAQRWGMTRLAWPAVGIKGWKNREKARKVEVTDELFNAMYAQADQLLRDSMDIATATGLRITDIRTVLMPINGVLRFRASKTEKWAEFDVADSPVLSALVKRREAMKVHSVMLLAKSTGKPVTERMLLHRWNTAKNKAIKEHPKIADQLAGLYNRDMRKRAADLAGDLGEASKLLQHSSTKLTGAHYFTKPTKLKAVR